MADAEHRISPAGKRLPGARARALTRESCGVGPGHRNGTRAAPATGWNAEGCMSVDIRIGTSGFHYKHWCGPFYPEKFPASKMLGRYLEHFDTVELNNSFYRLPTEDAFRCWRESTPDDFIFAVKASRFITHNKKLKDPENALENLLPRAQVLGPKLGPILFQLPPKWGVNVERLETLLSLLPKKHRYTFEFRELSWLRDDVNVALRKHNAALCIYELAGYHTDFTITADWTYVRLHGPAAGKYQGNYSDEQ